MSAEIFAIMIVFFLPKRSARAPVGISKSVMAIACVEKMIATLVMVKRCVSR